MMTKSAITVALAAGSVLAASGFQPVANNIVSSPRTAQSSASRMEPLFMADDNEVSHDITTSFSVRDFCSFWIEILHHLNSH